MKSELRAELEKFRLANRLKNRMLLVSTFLMIGLTGLIAFMSPSIFGLLVTLAVVFSWMFSFSRFIPSLNLWRDRIAEMKFGKKEEELSEEEKDEFLSLIYQDSYI